MISKLSDQKNNTYNISRVRNKIRDDTNFFKKKINVGIFTFACVARVPNCGLCFFFVQQMMFDN